MLGGFILRKRFFLGGDMLYKVEDGKKGEINQCV